MKRVPLKDTDRYTVERFRQLTKADRHAAWLESRGQGVGGSDMGSILGLNSYKTPYALWLEKTGRVEAEDISGKWAVVKGNALESELRKRFRAQHPELLVTDGTDKQFISRGKPYLRASLDGILQKEDGRLGILEIKTANHHRSADWHDKDGNPVIPPYYLAQVEFYALVTGWTWGYVYAAIGDDDPVEIPFQSDVEDMAAIDKAAPYLPLTVQAQTAVASDGTTPDYGDVFQPVLETDADDESWDATVEAGEPAMPGVEADEADVKDGE